MFKNFNLGEPILRALSQKGYVNPTPVQQEAIPQILTGKDVVACAQTGTGKTAAFCLPILEKLSQSKSNHIRALILVPTRELAIQVSANLKQYGANLSLRSCVVYGGVSQRTQEQELRQGVDIVVATPGRLLDLINQRTLNLGRLEILVLDEADRMLDMGFIHDVKRIIKMIPSTRQNIFFSATMPAEIRSLIASFMRSPVTVNISKKQEEIKIEQSVYFVDRDKKRSLLKHLIEEKNIQNAIVFARTKYGADKLARHLSKSGITADSIHGDKSQNARIRSLSNFKKNSIRVLVATDLAARGIDIADLPYVFNFELPESAETYTHRIGRTGRAGAQGNAVSFCDHEEKGRLQNINRILSKNLTIVDHPFA
jgi:ATP-dependent RNA helicase RhlE